MDNKLENLCVVIKEPIRVQMITEALRNQGFNVYVEVPCRRRFTLKTSFVDILFWKNVNEVNVIEVKDKMSARVVRQAYLTLGNASSVFVSGDIRNDKKWVPVLKEKGIGFISYEGKVLIPAIKRSLNKNSELFQFIRCIEKTKKVRKTVEDEKS